MTARLARSGLLLRLALAYFLVAQGLLGAAVSGLAVTPRMLADSGMLCAGSSHESAPGTDRGAGHADDILCCLTGCLSALRQPGLAPADGTEPLRARAFAAADFRPLRLAWPHAAAGFFLEATGPPVFS